MNIYIGIVLIVVVAFALGWAARALVDADWMGAFGMPQEKEDTSRDVSDYIIKYKEDNL